MSTQSVKSARRSAKTLRRTAKKGAKRTLAGSEKAAKAARRGIAKAGKTAARPALRGLSAARKQSQIIRTLSPPVQPVSADEAPVRHKYRVGETVFYTSPTFGRAAATGSYTVVKLLPSEGDDYQYRIKSSGEAFERVAKESQLDRV